MAAESFVEIARHWPYEERKRFSLWLMERAGWVMEQIGSAKNSSGGRSFVSPQVVIDTILLPTMAEWCKREPVNPEPHFWAGLYSLLSFKPDRHPVTYLKEAIRLDPAYAPAREALARHILEAISYNQHELTSGFSATIPKTIYFRYARLRNWWQSLWMQAFGAPCKSVSRFYETPPRTGSSIVGSERPKHRDNCRSPSPR